MKAISDMLDCFRHKNFANRYPDYNPYDDKIHVLYYAPYINGTGLYRAFIPALELNKTSSHSAIIMNIMSWNYMNQDHREAPPLISELIEWANYMVLPTMFSDAYPIIEKAKAINPDLKVFMDVDDNPFVLPPVYPNKKIFDEISLKNFIGNLAAVDNVIFSTDPLYEYLYPGSGRKKIIMPNFISNSLISPSPATEEARPAKIRIGMAVTQGHYSDVNRFRPVLRELGRIRNYELINIGWNGSMIAHRNVFEKINITCLPSQPFTQYFSFINSLQLSLAIIPLNNTIEFNQYKSPQRMWEFFMHKIPVVVDENSIYPQYAKEIVATAHDEDSWINTVIELLSANDKRRGMAQDGYRHTWANACHTRENSQILTEIFP